MPWSGAQLAVGLAPISGAVALGGLVTLIPIWISGLGTCKATTIAYLGSVGLLQEAALRFSLLVFVTLLCVGRADGRSCVADRAG